MKLIKFPLTIFTCFFLIISCSNDDDPKTNNDLEMASGTYNLVELNINPAQDINNDGNTTANILDELPCATGTLNLRNDETWTWIFTDINVSTITGGEFSILCTNSNTNRSGAWIIENNQITLFDSTNNYSFTKNEDRLTITLNEDLPGFKSMVFER